MRTHSEKLLLFQQLAFIRGIMFVSSYFSHRHFVRVNGKIEVWEVGTVKVVRYDGGWGLFTLPQHSAGIMTFLVVFGCSCVFFTTIELYYIHTQTHTQSAHIWRLQFLYQFEKRFAHFISSSKCFVGVSRLYMRAGSHLQLTYIATKVEIIFNDDDVCVRTRAYWVHQKYFVLSHRSD